MDYLQYIQWQGELQIGVKVGFEAQFSTYIGLKPSIYYISTFRENLETPAAFFYSLNNGETWISYPLGQQGMTFYTPYLIRLEIRFSHVGMIFCERDGVIYQISGDGRNIIDTYTVSDTMHFINSDKNDKQLYVGGEETLYKMNYGSKLSPANYSLNIGKNLSVVLDHTRNSFWQINENCLYLKDMVGQVLKKYKLPFPIAVEASSSSSSSSSTSSSSSNSSSSSTSSSSTWVRSSSSSSSTPSSTSSSSTWVRSSSSSSSSNSSSSSSSSESTWLMTSSSSSDSSSSSGSSESTWLMTSSSSSDSSSSSGSSESSSTSSSSTWVRSSSSSSSSTWEQTSSSSSSSMDLWIGFSKIELNVIDYDTSSVSTDESYSSQSTYSMSTESSSSLSGVNAIGFDKIEIDIN